ncbi:MAG: hypothetical protein Kow00121_04910 [Elainellaceae cyanobacterium]
MSPKRDDQQQVRTVISKDTYQLLKALAGLKGVSLNAVLNEAIDYWLESDATREMIQRHNLED